MATKTDSPKAIDLILLGESALHSEEQVRRTRAEINDQLKEKETEISEKIIGKLVKSGSHKSNLKVETTILLRKAIVWIKNWNYEVEYRDNDLLISEREDILDRIKLSEMNQVLAVIKEVITEEGLR
jgi:hypothetical protein